jgi:hypothetical protein
MKRRDLRLILAAFQAPEREIPGYCEGDLNRFSEQLDTFLTMVTGSGTIEWRVCVQVARLAIWMCKLLASHGVQAVMKANKTICYVCKWLASEDYWQATPELPAYFPRKILQSGEEAPWFPWFRPTASNRDNPFTQLFSSLDRALRLRQNRDPPLVNPSIAEFFDSTDIGDASISASLPASRVRLLEVSTAGKALPAPLEGSPEMQAADKELKARLTEPRPIHPRIRELFCRFCRELGLRVKRQELYQDLDVKDPKGSASTSTSRDEGGRKADLLHGLYEFLNLPVTIKPGIQPALYNLLGQTVIPEGSEILSGDRWGDILFWREGIARRQDVDEYLTPGVTREELPGYDHRYTHLSYLWSLWEGLRSNQLLLYKDKEEAGLPLWLSYEPLCRLRSDITNVPVRVHHIAQEGSKVRSITMGPTWLYLLTQVPRRLGQRALSRLRETYPAVQESDKLWAVMKSVGQVKWADEKNLSGDEPIWMTSESSICGVVDTDLSTATDLMDHEFSQEGLMFFFEALGLTCGTLLLESACFSFARNFYLTRRDYELGRVWIEEALHVTGIMMGESMSYIALNLQGLFAVRLSQGLVAMSLRALRTVEEICETEDTASLSTIAVDDMAEAFQVGDDQVVFLSHNLQQFDLALQHVYRVNLRADPSVGRHLRSQDLIILAEQHGVVQHRCLNFAPISYWRSEVNIIEGIVGQIEKVDLFKGRFISGLQPYNFISKVELTMTLFDYAEVAHPVGELRTSWTRSQFETFLRSRYPTEVATVMGSLERPHMPRILGGVSMPGPSLPELWEQVNEHDLQILSLLRGDNPWFTAIAVSLTSDFEMDPDKELDQLDLEELLLDILQAFSGPGSRKGYYSLEEAVEISRISPYTGELDRFDKPVKLSDARLHRILERQERFLTVNSYLSFLKQEGDGIPTDYLDICGDGYCPPVSPANWSNRYQFEYLQWQCLHRERIYHKMRETVIMGLLTDAPLSGLAHIRPWGQCVSAPLIDQAKSKRILDFTYVDMREMDELGFPSGFTARRNPFSIRPRPPAIESDRVVGTSLPIPEGPRQGQIREVDVSCFSGPSTLAEVLEPETLSCFISGGSDLVAADLPVLGPNVLPTVADYSDLY